MDEVILSPEEIAALPRELLIAELPGVYNTVVWRGEAGSYAGLMRVEAGRRLPLHRHRFMAHHAWIVDGTIRVEERTMHAGSYWYIPPGCGHGVDSMGPEDALIFYLYVPPAAPIPERMAGVPAALASR